MIAALLAAGPGAALSHRTAAHHWKLLPSMPPLIEVTLTDRIPRRRPGLRIHQAKRLVTTHQDLPVTTPLQTIAQLAPPDRDRARAEALVQKLIPRTQDDPAEPTRSGLERALLPALRKARLPAPWSERSSWATPVDFFWRDHNLVVETDGSGTHGHRRAFETDRARGRDFAGAWLHGGALHLAPSHPRIAARHRPHRPAPRPHDRPTWTGRRPHPPPRAADPPGRGVDHGFFPESTRAGTRVSV
jgi:hypothetical protein